MKNKQTINNIINNYREICLGGASVLLALLEIKEKGNIKNDINNLKYL